MKVHQLRKLLEQLDGSLDVNVYYPPFSTVYDVAPPDKVLWLSNTQRVFMPIQKNENQYQKPEEEAKLKYKQPKKRQRKNVK